MGSQQDGSAEQRRLDRENQAKVLGPWQFSRGRLEHARFVGAMTGFKQVRNGDIEIVFTVAFEHRDQVVGMMDASGIPVSVDVVPWKMDAQHEPQEGIGG